jgi:hypothetical protein
MSGRPRSRITRRRRAAAAGASPPDRFQNLAPAPSNVSQNRRIAHVVDDQNLVAFEFSHALS